MREISKFALKLSEGAGISELMKDLGIGLASAREKGLDLSLMGGGNPAHIPSVEAIFQEIWKDLGSDSNSINQILGDYSNPQGDDSIREQLASYLSVQLKSDISSENIAFTLGSQSAFFLLFNSFAGEFPHGRFKKVLLPITPEYIGYADQGIREDMFTSLPPIVETVSDHRFFYLPDMNRVEDRLKQGDIGAICLSRPTNPSGNVIPWNYIIKMKELASRHSIPFILDNAYGYPFPNILFREPKIQWDPEMIHVLSLSKLGLPGLRTGIIVAKKEIASRISEMTAVMNLAPGNIGPKFLSKLLENDLMNKISRNMIQPYYQEKSIQVQSIIDSLFQKAGIDYTMHESHGALFLWVRFPYHKKNSQDIYKEAKNQGLFLIPGDWFFPGLEETFSHRNECIRLTYSRNLEEVSKGIEILTKILS
ncbi:MAG: aminotransferase class I/II-fold pyridoxal phosphate-dependent enzyme [Leptospira sp.]|nr:aminotransferase class I/II-fold pyridoxal phosphate-dependent enzyme [Leptospira sp.]